MKKKKKKSRTLHKVMCMCHNPPEGLQWPQGLGFVCISVAQYRFFLELIPEN
jgi:hypothetical protein